MNRVLKSPGELQDMIVIAARKYPRCAGVAFAAIRWVPPDDHGCNWRLPVVGLPTGCVEDVAEFVALLRNTVNLA